MHVPVNIGTCTNNSERNTRKMWNWSAVGERKLEIAAQYSTSDTDNSGNYTRENTQGNFNKQVINKFDGFTCLAGARRTAVFTSFSASSPFSS